MIELKTPKERKLFAKGKLHELAAMVWPQYYSRTFLEVWVALFNQAWAADILGPNPDVYNPKNLGAP